MFPILFFAEVLSENGAPFGHAIIGYNTPVNIFERVFCVFVLYCVKITI